MYYPCSDYHISCYKKYEHLSQEQRYHIYALRKVGFSQKFIVQEFQVSPSTIRREI
ncbi:MAG TPA: helix-turn-helix domain-containing protein [Candidatus Aphodousia faecavium]|nr:helix-turn-helix domain-containing protein [Candidatus Aphodousia faecavium]